MFARTLEKKGLAIFCAFDYATNEGYIITTDPYKIQLAEDLANNTIKKVTIQGTEEMKYSDSLFLDIYCLRGNLLKENQSKELPPFINLGPNFELSNQFYAKAKKIWISLYPETYRKMIPEPKPYTQEELIEIQQKSNRK